MNELKIGDSVFVESYKHDGSLHRTWSKAFVIDIKEDYIVAVTDRTWVIESDGRRWLTKEPAICFYYSHKWYNVISMIRKTGIYYYVNLASPSLYDGEAIKNIDYDLDVKVFPDGSHITLDENEYEYHAQKMNYPEDIKKIVRESLDELIEMIDQGREPFSYSYINEYILKYFSLVYESEQAAENSEKN